MFANTQMGGMNMGFPDVCNTPIAGVPVPTPYPNLSTEAMGVPAAYNILFGGTPAHNLMTEVPLSQGDDPGVELGVASGVVMGPTRQITGAFTVIVDGAPATRLTSVTLQNLTNCPGVTLVPSQFTVLLLAP
ncbi:MAG: DUF4150 domain-containing protein [Candidatus Binataceae bacterium]